MNFQVVVQPRAFRDLDEIYEYLRERYSVVVANEWYNGFMQELGSLEKHPLRFGLARESRKLDIEVHQLLYRRFSHVHRALYMVDGEEVRILCVRHSAQEDVSPDEIR